MASSSLNESSFSDDDDMPIICTPVQNAIIVTIFVVSSLCLSVTVFVQVAFWKHNRHSKIVVSHSISLLIFYAFVTLQQFFVHPEEHIQFCYFLFVTNFCSVWSAVIWISIMSYDVWLYLSDMEPSTRIWRWQWQCLTCGCRQNKHRFMYYSIVAWGLPILIVVAILVINCDRRIQEALNLYPDIGTTCWFPSNEPSIWIFLHAPEIVFFLLNILFFALTIVTIRQTRLNCENIATNREHGLQQFILYIKLFAIMGLCFMGAVIVFTVNNRTTYWFGYVFDGFQGIAIFLAHFCKKTVFKVLKQKLCFWKNQTDNDLPMTSQRRLSSLTTNNVNNN